MADVSIGTGKPVVVVAATKKANNIKRPRAKLTLQSGSAPVLVPAATTFSWS